MKVEKFALLAVAVVATTLLATPALAGTQLILERGSRHDPHAVYTGVVDLVVKPGFDNAKVAVVVDGHKVADGLLSPHRLLIDFGHSAVQHKITVIATQGKQKAQWTEIVNRGYLPLTLRVKPVGDAGSLFEAVTTAPKDDPIESVQLWDNGKVVTTLTEAPYRFNVPPAMLAYGFVQVTAKTRSGEEAADFWSATGTVHAQELYVRTVPIFVSVVDRDGNTRTDVDRARFRIIDEKAEGRIIEFGKAFDQPISIALILDASASMTHSMQHASQAAMDFVDRALKNGDRCSVTAIHEVPRRKQALTSDRAAVAAALKGITPSGSTALYDAVASAIRELREEKNRRAIVVLSDGSDTASSWSYDELQKAAREAAIPIYFIVYESGEGDMVRQLEQLRFLAGETGGFVATATQQNLLAKYSEIEKDLRAQFAIRYQVSDFSKSNQYRRVRVVIDSPKLTARTIKGYFTP